MLNDLFFWKKSSTSHTHHTMASGYSLIELLVVVMLFSLAVLIMAQTYVQFVRLSRKTANAAAVQQDVRYVLELISRGVRNTSLDYSAAIPAEADYLRVLPEVGPYIMVKKSVPGDIACADDPDISCLLISMDGEATWAPLTGKHINVDEFKVFVHPTVSPFELSGLPLDYANNHQPFVTLYLTFTYKAPNEREQFTQSAQTTISSRVYVR